MPIRWMSFFTATIAFFLLTGCGSPVSIQTQHAQGVDYARYKTFIWHPQGFSSVGIPVQRAQLAQQTVRATVDNELTKKGIKPATFEAPDFYIASTVGAVSHAQVRKWGQGTGGYSGGTTDVPLEEKDVREGTIVLDFIDNQSGELIWRATAHGAVEPTDDPRAKVESTVRSMMDRFPPK